MNRELPVLLVGMLRSGTTFLERIVAGNAEIEAYDQPLPLLFVAVKRAYLAQSGRLDDARSYYPLNDQQFTNYDDPVAFRDWLGVDEVQPELVQWALQAMASYEGRLSTAPGLDARLAARPASGLAALVSDYLDLLAGERAPAPWRAFKETTGVEEFIPYWLAQGGRVIQIVRNPVDVARSMSSGAYGRYTGNRRPLLWIARNWRKSALYALAHRASPGFHLVDFTGATADPDAVNAGIRRFLGLGGTAPPIGSRAPNSSFAVLQDGAAPLPPDIAPFIEAWCFREMVALGMRPALPAENVEAWLERTPQLDFLERPQLRWLAYGPERRAEEMLRARALSDPHAPFEPAHTLFAEADRALRASG